LAPLRVDDPFAQARSELKYIESGIFGIPTIASPTDTYQEAIRHNVNGLLSNDDDWYSALALLITDADIRKNLGEAARVDVIENYGPTKRTEEWGKLISSILDEYSINPKTYSLKACVYFTRAMYFWATRKIRIAKRKAIKPR